MKEYSKKEASTLQEKQVANLVNGNVTVASGGTSHGGGDVLTERWFFECKTVTTDKDSYSVKKAVLEKLKEQTFEQMKDYGVLAFRFSPEGKDYFVVDSDTFKYMMQCTKYCDKNGVDVNE